MTDSQKIVEQAGQLIYEGTSQAHGAGENAGRLTTYASGLPGHGSIRPYGYLIKQPIDPVENYLPLFVNKEKNVYNGTVYCREVPPSSGDHVGFYSKTPIKGVAVQKVLYSSGVGCKGSVAGHPSGDSDVVLSNHFSGKPFRLCGKYAEILGYILPDV